MTSNPLAHAVDVLLEATVAGSFSRLGYEARRRLEDWGDPPPDVLAGKRILLTGATSGIGRAATAQLLELGAEVLVVGRDEQRTIRAVAELGGPIPTPPSWPIADMGDLDAGRKSWTNGVR